TTGKCHRYALARPSETLTGTGNQRQRIGQWRIGRPQSIAGAGRADRSQDHVTTWHRWRSRRATQGRNGSRPTRGGEPRPSYSEERNTKTATVTQTPTPTPKPAPRATPMPMLATAAPTPAPSTTPTNTLNGKAAAPQRKIFVPWLRFFPLSVIIPDTGLTRQ